MAAPAQRANLCKILLKDNTRIQVGQFSKWKGRGANVPELFHRLSGFNSAHKTSIRLVTPQEAELIVNPTAARPGITGAMAKSILQMSGVSTGYSFEKGRFATNTVFAYPATGGKLPEELSFTDSSGSTFVFPTGEFCGKMSALLVPDVSISDLEFNGSELRLNVPSERIIEFPAFPSEPHKYFVPQTGTPQDKKQERIFPLIKAAFRAIGGVVECRSGKIIHRAKEAFAGFIVRMGAQGDIAAEKDVFMNVSPFEAIDTVLVRVPDSDVKAFRENAD
ncbi:hypothetical protein JW721_05575 [Candidatus Micrarchaeota archaeon]|nr:hypothetical protein [Candidatus Micrarchaeota archaeon]